MNYKLEQHPDYGFLQIKPTPSDAEIAEYYANEFYASESPAQVNDSSLDVQTKDKVFYEAWRQDLVHQIESHFGRLDVSVMDFGCGWCETLAYFKKQGMSCFGIDTAPEAIEYGRSLGLNVEVSDLKEINPFGRKFDVVVMQNVLEHLADPIASVAEINNELLNPGGLFIVDVPNEFNEFQVAGKEVNDLNEWWVAPPAHLNYFNRDSLKALLEGEGFNIVDELSSFPLELYLLTGQNYVGNGEVGRKIHEQRMLFEYNLRSTGRTEVLHKFYRALAEINLGRQILMIGEKVG